MRLLPVLLASAVLGLAALALQPGLARGSAVDASEVVVGGVPEPAAPVGTTVDVRTYPVGGDTEAAVLASLVAAAPRADGETFFGLTVTELSFRYARSPAAAGCTLRNVRVDLAVSVALPEWAPGAEASYDLRRDWARFASNLRRHEDRHRVLAEAGAQALRTQLDGLTMATCADADAEARRRGARVQIETEAQHRRYDDETGHGRTQGAAWPL